MPSSLIPPGYQEILLGSAADIKGMDTFVPSSSRAVSTGVSMSEVLAENKDSLEAISRVPTRKRLGGSVQ